MKSKPRKPKRPKIEVSEPMQYVADNGYFFYVSWKPKFGPAYQIKCHADWPGAIPIIRDASINNLLLCLRKMRDELNGLDLDAQQKTGRKK